MPLGDRTPRCCWELERERVSGRGDLYQDLPILQHGGSGGIELPLKQEYTVPCPENFPFSSPSEWPKWKKRFERFREASGLVSKDEADQVNTLLYLMGEKAEDIFTSFKLDATTQKKYKDVVVKFDDHFVLKKNTLYERAKFNSRFQNQGESI
ncbi:unnamed protein product [Allacma fusca]|uniref:Uncharacterized protein n=1 Tax=Allacma fusca TaxID=39272 RepID=A0A8J2P969_9HEXA|nr:unnamed protein product [Allacma fusca]